MGYPPDSYLSADALLLLDSKKRGYCRSQMKCHILMTILLTLVARNAIIYFIYNVFEGSVHDMQV